MFIQTKVFDPSLEGQAVRLSGSLIEGNFIICKVNDYSLEVVGTKNKAIKTTTLLMSSFETGKVEMVVLEPSKGYAIPQPEKLPFEDLPPLEVLEDKKKNRTGFTRNQGTKNFRSDLQIKVDNAHVEYILKENVEPLKLEELLRRMREDHGHLHWNPQNASGFVLHAMKMGKKIKKSGFGHYSYDWEAAK